MLAQATTRNLTSPVPWVAPLVCYLLLAALAPSFSPEDSAADSTGPPAALNRADTLSQVPTPLASSWAYSEISPASKYLWLNAIQCVVIGAMLIYWYPIYRVHFPLSGDDPTAKNGNADIFRHPPPTSLAWGLGLAIGIVGLICWVGISQLRLEAYPLMAINAGLESLGLSSLSLPDRPGFNPFEHFASWQLGLFLVLRFAMLALVVPIAEEVFIRGFLVRMIDHGQWWKANFGSLTTGAMITASVYGAATHPEIFAAIIWFGMVTWLMIKSRSIWPCVLAHAVTNLLLGFYVIYFGQWALW